MGMLDDHFRRLNSEFLRRLACKEVNKLPVQPLDIVECSGVASSLDEARIVHACFRIMLPGFEVRTIEVKEQCAYRIEAFKPGEQQI